MSRHWPLRLLVGAAALLVATAALAQDTVRIGLVLPMTGPFASTGKQISAGARLYMQQRGDKAGGKPIELIIKDDAGNADTTKRIVQELLVNDGVKILAGFGLTPLALAAAPVSAQTRTTMVVMGAATSIVTERSPYIARPGMAAPALTVGVANWAPKNGIKKVVTLVSDFAPGIDIEKSFVEQFTAAGGEIVAQLRVPLANPDFAPFLQRARDANPEGLFVFVPAGQGAALMKQFVERGMDKSGIRLIGTGDMTDDDILNGFGDAALGVVTSHHYSAAHPSALNKSFVEAFTKANPGTRPNFMGVAGYDGMQLIYTALEKTGGSTDGDALIGAMKGAAWESPRGPIQIDADTRDIIQTIYVRKVERVNGELWNVEFDKTDAVKDPVKAAKK
jgi:branched-chain amino acid transport system substrate-binding protein